ncbi:MAG: YlbF family regulator, partial [Candidatus Aminicenantaceae bacterium]
MMNPEAREKARDFAYALKSSPPIEKFLDAKKKMEKDRETQRLVVMFQEKQRELWLKQRDGTFTPEDMKTIRELQYKVINNPLIRELSGAQDEAFEFCRSVG